MKIICVENIPITQEQINNNANNAKFNVGDKVRVGEQSSPKYNEIGIIKEIVADMFKDMPCYKIMFNDSTGLSFLKPAPITIQENHLERA